MRIPPEPSRSSLAWIDADDPRPAGCKKLRGRNGYRIRVGEYRVLYQIDDAKLSVFIDHVSPRGGAYK